MPKTTTVVTDPKRLQDIAAAIYGAAAPVSMADSDKREMAEALDGAKTEAVNQRELTMFKVAQLSREGAWTEQEIKAATALAAKMGNALEDKSLATFIAETRRAAHPQARMHFEELRDARDAAWDAEDQLRKLDKDAPCPLRKAFARRYHTLIRQLGECAETGYILDDVKRLVEYARENDPDLDAGKVLGKIESLRDKLATFVGEFPDDDLKAAVELLSGITKVDLDKAHEPVVRERRAAAAEELETTTVVTEAEDAEAEDAEAEDGASEPVAGVVDPWGDLMAEAA